MVRFKSFPGRSWEDSEGGGMLGIHPYFFDIRHSFDGRAVSCKRRPHLTPTEIPWYSFLVEAERTAGLLNVDRRNRKVT